MEQSCDFCTEQPVRRNCANGRCQKLCDPSQKYIETELHFCSRECAKSVSPKHDSKVTCSVGNTGAMIRWRGVLPKEAPLPSTHRLANSDAEVKKEADESSTREIAEPPPQKSQKSEKTLPVNAINDVDFSLPVGGGLQPGPPEIPGADASAGPSKNLKRPDLYSVSPISPIRPAAAATGSAVDNQGARDPPAPRLSAEERVAIPPEQVLPRNTIPQNIELPRDPTGAVLLETKAAIVGKAATFVTEKARVKQLIDELKLLLSNHSRDDLELYDQEPVAIRFATLIKAVGPLMFELENLGTTVKKTFRALEGKDARQAEAEATYVSSRIPPELHMLFKYVAAEKIQKQRKRLYDAGNLNLA